MEKTGSNKIAIAHNKNDKVETIIMHLLRGSGISGLQGIEPIKDGKIKYAIFYFHIYIKLRAVWLMPNHLLLA